MTDRELFQKTFSHLHASGDTIAEVMKMKNEQRKKRGGLTKKAATVLIAAALALALTITGFATGYIQSVFIAMKGHSIGDDDQKYETIDRLSDKTEVTRSAALPEMAGSRFTLSQSYYDGENLMLAYSLDALTLPADFDFGPGSANFDKLKSIRTEDTELMLDLKKMLSAEEYAEFERRLATDGSAGVVFYDVILNDHVKLADGRDIGPYNSTTLDGGVYMEFQTPLAEAARDRDVLDIHIRLNCSTWYFYQDASGGRYYHEPSETEALPFTIPRSVG